MPTEAPLSFVHHFAPASSGGPAAGRFADVTLLLLHGTGGDERDLLPLGQALAPGAALLSPRGQVMEGSAPRFFRRLAEGVFDVPDLVARTHELAAFVERASAQYGFAARVVAVGFSNGANIAVSTLLLHPRLLAGAVLLRAMVPFELAEPVRLPATPVYLGGGERDPIVPRASTERLAALLRDAGAAVTLGWQPTGHQLTPGDVQGARQWLQAFARRPAAP